MESLKKLEILWELNTPWVEFTPAPRDLSCLASFPNFECGPVASIEDDADRFSYPKTSNCAIPALKDGEKSKLATYPKGN